MEQKYDVFISYSRKDYLDENKNIIPNNVILQVKESLENAGISCWYDQEGILDGDNYAKLISQNIQASKVFVFISTKNANSSEWTGSEIATAHMMGKHIIPVRVDDSAFHVDVILYIAKLSFIDYQTNPEKGLKDLVKSVKAYIAKIEAEEKRKKEEEEKRLEEERRIEEERKRQKELEAQRHKAEQERIINEIKTELKTLNDEETKLMARRSALIVKTERITDSQQKENLKSSITESSPIRKQFEEECKSYKEKINVLEKRIKVLTDQQNTSEADDFKNKYKKKQKLCWLLGIVLFLSIGASLFFWLHGKNETSPTPKTLSNQGTESITIIELVNTGNEYFYGENGKPQSYDMALWYYSKAAEKGSSTAQTNIGIMYQNGNGVKQNYEEAVKWYRLAAEQGNADGQYHLGYMYQFGYGLKERDTKEAIKWYRKAAEQGHKLAQTQLETLTQ